MSFDARATSIEFLVDEVSDMLLARENLPSVDGAMISKEVLRLPLEDVRVREPAEIRRAIGGLVLSFLNSRSLKGLNLPRDIEYEKKLDEEHFAQLRQAANSNEPEALYNLAVSLIAHGMNTKSWAEIEQGETFLNQAIAAGLPEAINYQSETWALIRPRLEQKLKQA